jgi:hypothetical protein
MSLLGELCAASPIQRGKGYTGELLRQGLMIIRELGAVVDGTLSSERKLAQED